MMNCPACGAIMVWLNGSVLHDPPTKFYQCRRCNINVTKLADGTIESDQPEQPAQ
ncbi:hypothetical protein [Candidatus Nitrososphaera sp. FF02]|uniref:hypothetical protein n=1 Tax=Candidatus Nitrososphaera sp. FF02 TaxID=3398226 RepID=UPI002FB6B28B